MTDVVPASRRELNKLRTRAAIIKAARASFAEIGIAGATMDQIADAAEVSRATLFNYFSSKADIVAAVVEQLDTDFIALVESYRARPMTTGARIIGIFSDSGRTLEKRRDVMRPLVVISEQSWGEGPGMSRIARLIDVFTQLLGGEGVSDVRTDTDVRLLAEMLVSVYIGMIHNWRTEEAYPIASRLRAAAQLMAETITAR